MEENNGCYEDVAEIIINLENQNKYTTSTNKK